MSFATWAGRSKFDYTGDIAIGTKISFGKTRIITVTAQQYAALRETFLEQVVHVGTSFNNPRPGSIGEWLLNNVTRTAIASYVAPILIREGYAVRESKTEIRIIR